MKILTLMRVLHIARGVVFSSGAALHRTQPEPIEVRILGSFIYSHKSIPFKKRPSIH